MVTDSGKTGLHEACQGGHVEVVELILDYIGDVDVADKAGQTAVHVAALNGEVLCLQALCDRGISRS